MKRVMIVVGGCIFVAAAAAGCGGSPSKTAQVQSSDPKQLSRVEAEKIALARVPNGSAQSGELENENGHLVWSFDFTRPGTANVTEVQVDAYSGKVVNVAVETPADQKKENLAP